MSDISLTGCLGHSSCLVREISVNTCQESGRGRLGGQELCTGSTSSHSRFFFFFSGEARTCSSQKGPQGLTQPLIVWGQGAREGWAMAGPPHQQPYEGCVFCLVRTIWEHGCGKLRLRAVVLSPDLAL